MYTSTCGPLQVWQLPPPPGPGVEPVCPLEKVPVTSSVVVPAANQHVNGQLVDRGTGLPAL